MLRYKVQSMAQRILKYCDEDNVEEARAEYEAAKEFIKNCGEAQSRLQFLITPTGLINAYIRLGKSA